jgi:hypothetical protein
MNEHLTRSTGSFRARAAAIGAASMLLWGLAVPPAHAAPIRPAYHQINSPNSVTGAIYHRVKDGHLIAPAYVVEKGQKVKIRMGWMKSGQTPYGVKVWQPAGTCLKVYQNWGVWLRTHNYRKQARGRDVWVTKGLKYAGGEMKTKIVGC